MNIVHPLKQILIDYQIQNVFDVTTYYVRAVIKNSITGNVLATVNLSDNGNQYFSALWTAPNDFSGTGLQLSVFTTVYTDASYTTISANYGTTLDTYIVRAIPTTILGGFANGPTWENKGSPMDLSEIRKIIREETKTDEITPVSLKEILARVSSIEKKIVPPKDVVFPQTKDYSDEIARVHRLIAEVPTRGELSQLEQTIAASLESIVRMIDEHKQSTGVSISKSGQETMRNIKKMLDEIESKIPSLEDMPLRLEFPKEMKIGRPERQNKQMDRINALMNL